MGLIHEDLIVASSCLSAIHMSTDIIEIHVIARRRLILQDMTSSIYDVVPSEAVTRDF